MKFLILLALIFSLFSPSAQAGNVNVYSYSGGTVTTSAYTVAWVSVPTSVSQLEICDTSTKIIKIATGATGSEVDIATAPVSGCIMITNLYIPAGTQISIKAIDASATSGYNLLSIH